MNEPIKLIKRPDQTERENKIFEKLRGKDFIAIFWDDKNIGYHTTSKDRREAYFSLMQMADMILHVEDFENEVEL